MQEEVFDQNDGSESAADESGAKKKRKGVLYIISASAVEGRLLVHAGLATQKEIISIGIRTAERGGGGGAADLGARH